MQLHARAFSITMDQIMRGEHSSDCGPFKVNFSLLTELGIVTKPDLYGSVTVTTNEMGAQCVGAEEILLSRDGEVICRNGGLNGEMGTWKGQERCLDDLGRCETEEI